MAVRICSSRTIRCRTFYSSTGAQQMGGGRVVSRGRIQRQRPGSLRDGRRFRRFRRRWMGGSLRRQCRSGDVLPLSEHQRNETYSDLSRRNNVAQATRLLSGWGLKFFDYDNDGNLDLLLANGHPDDMIENYSQAGEVQGTVAAVSKRRRQVPQCERRSGPGVSKSFAARGLAVGDFNNDGKLDVLIANNGGRACAAQKCKQRRAIIGSAYGFKVESQIAMG